MIKTFSFKDIYSNFFFFFCFSQTWFRYVTGLIFCSASFSEQIRLCLWDFSVGLFFFKLILLHFRVLFLVSHIKHKFMKGSFHLFENMLLSLLKSKVSWFWPQKDERYILLLLLCFIYLFKRNLNSVSQTHFLKSNV